MHDFLPVLLFILIGAYALITLIFMAGWLVQPRKKPIVTADRLVTVLIPCRNEESNIAGILHSLLEQEYPANLLEIIWVDDHSTDATSSIFKKICLNHPNHRLIELPEAVKGKKAALRAGASEASGDYILLTDADSRPSRMWIRSMVSNARDENADLVAGPVILGPAIKWHHPIQTLEYLSLTAVSAGAMSLGYPVMLQGPNVCVKTGEYKKIVTDLNDRFLSGDDMFLLQALKKNRDARLVYNFDPQAIVFSLPATTLGGFLRQRQRWASKSTGYTDPLMIATTLIVFLANVTLISGILGALSGWVDGMVPLYLYGVKVAVDLPLLCIAAIRWGKTRLLWWFLPLSVFYPVYILYAGILAMTRPVRWKS